MIERETTESTEVTISPPGKNKRWVYPEGMVSKREKRLYRKQMNSESGGEMKTELSVTPELVQLEKLEYDKKIFETMSTDTVVDEFFSNKGGLPRACNFILIGDPGSGKCVTKESTITVRNKHTGEINEMAISEFHEMQLN